MKGKGPKEIKELNKKIKSHSKNLTTNTIDLMNIAEGLGIKVDFLSKEEYKKLAEKNEEPKKVIVNMDSEGSGTHWVSFRTDNNGIIHYYDSFGVFPPIFIKKRLVLYNVNIDQHPNDSNCGFHAIHSLL